MNGVPALEQLLAPHRTVAVVGLAKNAGKTTVINHLLERIDGPVGLVSLGLDGEARDQLTGLPKPSVRPRAGTLVASAAGLVDERTVRMRLGFRTAVGEVVVTEPPPGEPVVVSGPARLDELDRTVEALFHEGARRVVLEGALGRLGPAAPGRAEAVVLAAGVSLANGRDDAALRLRLAVDALALPVTPEPAAITVRHAAGYEPETAAAIADAGSAEVQGAVTGPLLERLMRDGAKALIVAPDATHVLARPQQLARARRAGVEVAVRQPLAIAAVTSNPFHPDAPFSAEEAFAMARDAAAARWPVYDVVSGMLCP
ncbi:MAG TPA: hypothetical protein VE824_04920 [Gaiellales bacterium]|nr:hypothetical protein [Gaiellales bacterium]